MILDYVNQFSTTLQRELLRQLGHGVVPNDAKGRSAAPGEGFPPLHKRWPTCNPHLVLSKYVRFRVWNGGTWECVQVRLENCVARPEVISRCKQPDESEVGNYIGLHLNPTVKPLNVEWICWESLKEPSSGLFSDLANFILPTTAFKLVPAPSCQHLHLLALFSGSMSRFHR